jgi:hypothetical protein
MKFLKFSCDCESPELLINIRKSFVPIAKIECANCGCAQVTLNVSIESVDEDKK